MSEHTNHHIAASFDNLTPMQQGCLDCIIYCETNGDNATVWQDVGREDIDSLALDIIVADCERFLEQVSDGDPDFEGQLFADVDEADFGWQFHLERQGTGVGFAELHISQPLLSRLIMNATIKGPIEFAVTGGKVRVAPSPDHVYSAQGAKK